MRYEFVPYGLTADRPDLVYDMHPEFPEYLTGHYSDDRQMSLANRELVLSKDYHDISPEEIAGVGIDY
jgi:hypothetical protein